MASRCSGTRLELHARHPITYLAHVDQTEKRPAIAIKLADTELVTDDRGPNQRDAEEAANGRLLIHFPETLWAIADWSRPGATTSNSSANVTRTTPPYDMNLPVQRWWDWTPLYNDTDVQSPVMSTQIWDSSANATQMNSWAAQHAEFYMQLSRWLSRDKSDDAVVNKSIVQNLWLLHRLEDDFDTIFPTSRNATINHSFTSADFHGLLPDTAANFSEFQTATRVIQAGRLQPVVAQALHERGCCQVAVNDTKCKADQYPAGVCTALRDEPVACVDGMWNDDAQLANGVCCNAIVLRVSGVLSCSPPLMPFRQDSHFYGEAAFTVDVNEARGELTVVRRDGVSTWEDNISFPCLVAEAPASVKVATGWDVAAEVYQERVKVFEEALAKDPNNEELQAALKQANATADDLIQRLEQSIDRLRHTASTQLSDLERWCLRKPDLCTFHIQHRLQYQEMLWINRTLVNNTNSTSAPAPGNDERRRHLQQNTDGDKLAERAIVKQDNVSFSRPQTVHVPVGRAVRVTLNISSDPALEVFNKSTDSQRLLSELTTLATVLPRMYEGIRLMLRPELSAPWKQRRDMLNDQEIVSAITSTANATNTTAPEPEPEPNPQPEPEPDIDGEHKEIISSLQLGQLVRVGLTDQLIEMEDAFIRFAHQRQQISCFWRPIARHTFCVNREKISDQGMTLEQCGLAVLANSPVATPESLGSGSVCALQLFRNKKGSCQCVSAGERCERQNSTAGNTLYEHTCVFPAEKTFMLEQLQVGLPQLCAMYAALAPLVRITALPDRVVKPSCTDGMRNGDELGVDCGGLHCSICPPVEVAPCREHWYGLHCEDGMIVRMDLAQNGLSGRIDHALHLLPPTLRTIDMRSNALRGSIPTSLAAVTELRVLDLSSNLITGPFPEELRQLQNLTHVQLAQNSLGGR